MSSGPFNKQIKHLFSNSLSNPSLGEGRLINVDLSLQVERDKFSFFRLCTQLTLQVFR